MEQHDNLIRQNQISWSYNTDHMVPAARRRSCGCKPSVPCIPLLRSPSERLNKDKLSEGLVSGCMFCCISISLLLNDVFIIDHQWEVWGRGGGGVIPLPWCACLYSSTCRTIIGLDLFTLHFLLPQSCDEGLSIQTLRVSDWGEQWRGARFTHVQVQ